MSVTNQVVLITGGANGIGRETALLFARHGAKVMLADFDAQGGWSARDEVRQTGAEVEFVKADVSRPDDVARMVEQTLKRFSRIDVLINNAGVTQDGFLINMTSEQWEKVISINLSGVFYCTRAVAKGMVERGQGVILNAASVVGLYGNMGQTNYAASKAGVIGMTKTWAKELGPKGIRVNAVAPGFIATGMTAKVPEKVLDTVKQRTPLRRLGLPSDIAQAYLFLASDAAGYINGAVLSVDGGLVL